LVNNDKYVIHLCRYIHLNPVRAGLVSNPGEWIYSNYLEWIEQRDGTFVDFAFIQQYFSTPKDYEAFVLSEIDQTMEEKIQPYYFD
jgi:putative transposase